MIANRRVLRHAVLVASDGGEVEYRQQVALRGFLNCLICDRKLIRRAIGLMRRRSEDGFRCFAAG